MHLLIAREAVDAAPVGGRRHHRPGRRPRPQGQGRRAGRRLLRPVAADPGRRPGPAARRVRRVRPAGQAPALRRARRRASWPGRRSTAMARWQGKLERKQALPRPDRRHRRRAVRDVGGLRAGHGRAGRAARRASSWPTCSAGRPGCGSRRCSTALWDNTDAADVAAGASGSSPAGTPSWRRASSPRPTSGDWVATWEPGPSTADDVRRRIPPRREPCRADASRRRPASAADQAVDGQRQVAERIVASATTRPDAA